MSSVTGKPVVGATNRLSYFFSHVDHLSSARPSDLSEELDAMTVIKAFIPNVIYCRVQLIGEEISCEPRRGG